VAFLQQSSTQQESVRESTLEQVARGEVAVRAPAVFVIGEVVRLRTANRLSGLNADALSQPWLPTL
jgi:uroporphyrin-III C-methyltransferase